MAWTIDTNFGSTITASSAFAPFVTGGGNRIINFSGAGVVYRSDISQADVELSCDLTFTDNGSPFSGSVPSAFLIARRQSSDGSFYATAILKHTNGGENLQLYLYKYNGTTDTFTVLSLTSILASHPLAISPFDLTKYRFRVQGDSLSAELANSSNQTVIAVGAINSDISAAGSPGIGANLVVGARKVPTFGDNLQIDSI